MYVYVCRYIYIYICMYVCMYIYIYQSEGFPRTGYLIPVRDALWDLPGWRGWRVAVVVGVGVILKSQDSDLNKLILTS